MTTVADTVVYPGTYTCKKFSNQVRFSSAGTYNFVDSDLSWQTVTGGSGIIVNTDHSIVRGLWTENNTGTGAGGHAGWTINWSLLDGGAYGYQAFRPKGTGTLTINDSLVVSYNAPNPADTTRHTEAMQAMSGARITANRVGFSMEPKWFGSNTSVTAVMTFESPNDGTGSVFTDCEFGHMRTDGAWGKGGGYYAIYPAKGSFVRPRIHTGTAGSSSGAWYSAPVSLTSPTYLA